MDKKHCGKQMIALQYHYTSPNHYDGVSEWRCSVCGYREGRWSGKELKDDEEEKIYGG